MDTDCDGVVDFRDCRPFNRKQDSDDWIRGKKRKPEIEKNIHDREVSYDKWEEMDKREKMEYIDGIENTLIAKRNYKSYLINFHKYPHGHKSGKDVYLPGIVYAHGFEYDPTLPHNVKHGKLIGTGKTLNQAFNEAKKYIDKEGSTISKKEIQEARNRQKEFDKISKRIHQLISIGARRDLNDKEIEEIMMLQDKLYEWRDRGLRFESD